MHTSDNMADLAYTRLTDHSPALNWLTLVDPTLGDPLDTLLEGTERPVERRSIRLPFPDKYCPYLLKADNPRDAERILSASVRLAHVELAGVSKGVAPAICAWLCFEQIGSSLNELALRLGQNAAVRTPAANTSTVFRYYDPRLSTRLIPIIGLDGWRALAAASWNAWWVADAQEGAFPVAPASNDLPISSRNAPLCLSDREFLAIQHLGWANRIEMAACQWMLPGPVARQTMEHVASAAMSRGLTADKDILAFAYCALTWHLDFHRYPDIEALFMRIADEGENAPGFGFLVDQIDEDRWHRIIRWLADRPVLGAS